MIFGEFTTKTGHIRVEILDGGDEEQVEISDIGSLKYEFDLVPDSPNVEAVQALYEKINIEIFQHGYSRTDLYDRLIENVKSQGGVRVDLYLDDDAFPFFIQLNDIELSEIERTISLECRVLFDDTTTVLQVFDEIPKNLIEKFVPDSEFAETEFLDATGVADWIAYAMREVFLNDFDSIVESGRTGLNQAYNQRNYTSFEGGISDRVGFLMAKIQGPDFETYAPASKVDTTIEYVGDKTFRGSNFFELVKPGDRIGVFVSPAEGEIYEVDEVLSDSELTIVDFGAGTEINEAFYFWDVRELIYFDEYSATEALQELAAIEGAIYGTGFGRNFFVNRITDQLVVDIPWDEITDMNPEPFWNPFGNGAVTQLARTFSDSESQTLNEGVDNFGVIPTSGGNWILPRITDARSALPKKVSSEYSINLSLPPGYPFLNKAKGQPNLDRYLGNYSGSPQSWFRDFQPSIALCRSGLRALQSSLSSDGDSLFIQFSCYEAKRVKPWNLIRIVDGSNNLAPQKYKEIAFRPTSIEYDFVRDLVTVEAYQVRGFDFRFTQVLTTPDGIDLTTTDGKLLVTQGIDPQPDPDPDPELLPDPTNVSLILNAINSTLGWSQPELGEPDKYRIDYSLNGGIWNVLDNNVAGNLESYPFDACAIANNNDTLQLRIRAHFSDEVSDFVQSNTDRLSGCF